MNFREKIDYSAMSSYIDCPRKFFFQYILHLRWATANLDLVFGSCWHYGLECAYLAMMEDPDISLDNLVSLSRAGFEKLWNIEGTSFNEEFSFPKNPGNAYNMYHAYWHTFYRSVPGLKILGVETPFVINISEDLPNYIGRLDLTKAIDDAVIIIDHKTAKFVNETTLAGYDSSLQSDGYLAAGYLYYDKLPTLVYEIAQVAKTKSNFYDHTVMKQRALIDRTLHDIKYWMLRVLSDIEEYEIEKLNPDASNRTYIQTSFRRSPGYACTQYFRKCSYFDLCHLRNNSLSYENNTPAGYEVCEWDPDLHHESMQQKLAEVT